MMTNPSRQQFGSVTKALHWVVALLVGWQILKFGDRIDEGEHWIGQTLVSWHVSIGTLLLLMAIFWIFWTISQKNKRPHYDRSGAFFAKAGHSLIFAGLLLMPLTGILRLVGAGYPLTAFGIELIPAGEENGWALSIGNLHSPLGWVMAALIIGHAAMALVHHFVIGDDTLSRMTPLGSRD